MSANWSAIGRPGDPVVGNPITFERLEGQFRTVRSDVRRVNDELQAIRFGGGEFRGKAADTFENEIASVDNYLDDFGDVCQQIESIMEHHANRLRAMRDAADSALARAQTHWNEKNAAEDDLRESDTRVRSLRYQIDSLADEDGGAQRDYLTRQCNDAEWVASQANRRINRAEGELEVERKRWDDLHSDEEDLSKHTSQKLRNIDLESLANPSWLSQRLSDIAGLDDFVLGALAAIGEAISNAMDGLLGDLLMALYEALDIVLLVLSVAVFFLSMTGIGAPLAVFLGAVVLVLSAVKLVLGVSLRLSGRDISGWQIALDLLSVVTAGAPKILARGAKFGRIVQNSKIFTPSNNLKILRLNATVSDLSLLHGIVSSDPAYAGEGSLADAGRQNLGRMDLGEAYKAARPLRPTSFAPAPLFGLDIDVQLSWDIGERHNGGTRCLAPTGW